MFIVNVIGGLFWIHFLRFSCQAPSFERCWKKFNSVYFDVFITHFGPLNWSKLGGPIPLLNKRPWVGLLDLVIFLSHDKLSQIIELSVTVIAANDRV
jgi:hypothetical protein